MHQMQEAFQEDEEPMDFYFENFLESCIDDFFPIVMTLKILACFLISHL